MNQLWRRLVITTLSRNILYNFAGQALLSLVGLIAVRYVFRGLGQDALGIINFTVAMNTLLVALLDMGISASVTREISLHGSSEPSYVRDLVRTASLLCWAGYFALTMLVFVLAPWLVAHWIHLKTLDAGIAVQALRLLGAATLTALPRSLYGSVFRGFQRLEINNAIDVATSCVQQFGTIAIVARHGSLIEVAIWFIGCFGLSTAAYAIASVRFLPWRAILPKYSSSIVRRNLSFSGNMLSISLLSIVTNQADKLTVSKLLPIRDFGPYGFAGGTAAKVNMVTAAIGQAAFPSFAAGVANSDASTMLSQYRKLQDFVCILTLPLFAALCFAELPLFTYVFNAATAASLLLPVAWLCLGYYINATLSIPYIFSIATGRPDITAKSTVLALFIVLPVTVLLVWRFGLPGAGFSWVCYQLFNCGYIIPRICSECLRIPTLSWFVDLGRILALAAATYGVSWIAIAITANYTVTSLFIAYAAASTGFVAGAFLLAGPELKSAAIRRGVV